MTGFSRAAAAKGVDRTRDFRPFVVSAIQIATTPAFALRQSRIVLSLICAPGSEAVTGAACAITGGAGTTATFA